LSEPLFELGGTKSIALTFNLTLLKVWGKSADWATMLFKLQRLMKASASGLDVSAMEFVSLKLLETTLFSLA
jgi:hypothetical protein